MKEKQGDFDVIIVGGGIAGLGLGAMLSRDGKKVLVLEKGARTGGRASIQKKEGFTVDYGIHLIRFGPKSAVSKICGHLGRRIEYAAPGPSYVFDRDGRKKLFPTGPGGFVKTGMFGLRERLLAMALMMKIRKGRFDDLKGTSVLHWMGKNGISGGLSRYFTLVSASMMVCPFIERSSAGEMLANVQRVLETGLSVMYPRGGWGPILELYESGIRARGEIRTEAKADSIVFEGDAASGVRCAGAVIRARSIVLSLPVQRIFDGLLDPGRFAPALVDGCRTLRPTAGIVLDYGLKRKICDDSGLLYLWSPMSFGIFTSNLEPCLAPPGGQLLTWLCPVNLEDLGDPAVAEGLERDLEKALGRIYPELGPAVQWRRAMRLRMVDGVEVNIHQTRERRVGPRLPGVRNLFVAGDGTAAPGAGGDVGHESVLECYTAVTGGAIAPAV